MKYQGRGNNNYGRNHTGSDNNKQQNWTPNKFGMKGDTFPGAARSGSQLFGKIVTPGPKKGLQFNELRKGLISEATQLKMPYVATAIKNMEDVKKKDIMPEKPDQDKYGKTIKKPATDDSGKTIKDGEGKVVMVDISIVTDQDLKDNAYDTYNMEI